MIEVFSTPGIITSLSPNSLNMNYIKSIVLGANSLRSYSALGFSVYDLSFYFYKASFNPDYSLYLSIRLSIYSWERPRSRISFSSSDSRSGPYLARSFFASGLITFGTFLEYFSFSSSGFKYFLK